MQIRRSERAITDIDAITAVLDRCLIGRLGLVDSAGPYVVPVNFAYAIAGGRITVYMHGAPEGRKIAAIKADPRCCFEADCFDGLSDEGTGACGLSAYYQSAIGFGDARLVTDDAEARQALAAIVARQAPELVDTLPTPIPSKVQVIAVDLDTVTGKQKLV